MLESVKQALGIYYSDAQKDAEVQGIIDAAALYFAGAGWDISTPDALAVQAVVLYCKMAQSTDPMALVDHPMLKSFIVQGRAVATE